MTTYTADDFRTARFATDARGNTARRTLNSVWETAHGARISDKDMAADGWVPVREHDQTAEETIADLRDLVQINYDTLDLHRETTKDLRRMIAERDDQIRGLMEDVVAARQEVSLDTLREAWENAEVPTDDTPARVGDTVIGPLPYGGYEVYEKTSKVQFPHQRIFKRAPREPWADLADVLGRLDLSLLSDEGAAAFAEVLHHDGVRVAGGDDQ